MIRQITVNEFEEIEELLDEFDKSREERFNNRLHSRNKSKMYSQQKE
jgi:hypothetical protein